MRNILFIYYILLLFSIVAYSKRAEPKPVPPIIKDGIQYIANECGTGCIQAIAINSNKELWNLTLYKIEYANNIERDVQTIFINEMYLAGNHLLVKNELNFQYEINLSDHSFVQIISVKFNK